MCCQLTRWKISRKRPQELKFPSDLKIFYFSLASIDCIPYVNTVAETLFNWAGFSGIYGGFQFRYEESSVNTVRPRFSLDILLQAQQKYSLLEACMLFNRKVHHDSSDAVSSF